MTFVVVPALDVSSGRLARLTREGVEPVLAFAGDPLAAAESLSAAGASMLHVVDLDLAMEGVARNVGSLASICRLGVTVQASGGITAAGPIAQMFEAGASRVVLGSGILGDRALLESLVDEERERVVVGLEVDASRVRSRGSTRVDLPLDETLEWLATVGATRFLVTEVGRVGALEGPDLSSVEPIIDLGKPVMIAGGISSMSDIESVRATGAEAAVVGRALLDGRLEPRAALELSAGGPAGPD